MRYYEEAKNKLDAGVQQKLDQYGEVMKNAVHDALLEFIGQDEEFAQAVVQGGSFEDAMAAVTKQIKGRRSISDMEAYGAAVRFFFPGAEIRVSMTIDLIGAAAAKEPEKENSAVIIDLSDFF